MSLNEGVGMSNTCWQLKVAKQHQSLVHPSFYLSEQVKQDKGVDARQRYPSFLRKEEVGEGKKERKGGISVLECHSRGQSLLCVCKWQKAGEREIVKRVNLVYRSLSLSPVAMQ